VFISDTKCRYDRRQVRPHIPIPPSPMRMYVTGISRGEPALFRELDFLLFSFCITFFYLSCYSFIHSFILNWLCRLNYLLLVVVFFTLVIYSPPLTRQILPYSQPVIMKSFTVAVASFALYALALASPARNHRTSSAAVAGELLISYDQAALADLSSPLSICCYGCHCINCRRWGWQSSPWFLHPRAFRSWRSSRKPVSHIQE
jgi:hypothetical protein